MQLLFTNLAELLLVNQSLALLRDLLELIPLPLQGSLSLSLEVIDVIEVNLESVSKRCPLHSLDELLSLSRDPLLIRYNSHVDVKIVGPQR